MNNDPNFQKKYVWTLILVGLILLIGRGKLDGHNSGSNNTILSADLSTTTPTTTSTPTSSSSSSDTNSTPATSPPATAASSGKYRDGTYTGKTTDAYYGNVQLRVTVAGSKISKVDILDYPHDNRTSSNINNQVLPMLQKEVLQTQSGPVDAVSGASFTSQAFNTSLQSALSQAA